jgi:hypothetical protein
VGLKQALLVCAISGNQLAALRRDSPDAFAVTLDAIGNFIRYASAVMGDAEIACVRMELVFSIRGNY